MNKLHRDSALANSTKDDQNNHARVFTHLWIVNSAKADFHFD